MATIGSNIGCRKCTRTFRSRPAMEQHYRDVHVHNEIGVEKSSHETKNREQYYCNICCRSFRSDGAIYNHNWDKHGVRNREKIRRCYICHRSFVHLDAVQQHTNAKHMNTTRTPTAEPTHSFAQTTAELHLVTDAKENQKLKRKTRRTENQWSLQDYLMNYSKIKTDVINNDAKSAYKYVYSKVEKILSKVREQEGGEIFSQILRKAGSNVTGTKVGKADEFDFNIPLNIQVQQVIEKGTVPYTFRDKEEGEKKHSPSPSNMNVERELIAIGKSYKIPPDYMVVVVDTGSSQTMNGILRGKHLVPHFLQQRLHSCIAKALEGETDIALMREVHGPAITMMFRPQSGHHISVDLTMVIDWPNITVNDYDWPRRETKEALSIALIDKIKQSGCQLVPKGDEFWNMSFSNCETILMKEIDRPGECRKTCHKLLKSFFQTWKSRSKTGYGSISSFIFKHLTFWMNEKYHEPGFWKQENLSARFIDTLKELRTFVNSKKLPNYFIPEENILGIRDQYQLKELAEEVGTTIHELENNWS